MTQKARCDGAGVPGRRGAEFDHTVLVVEDDQDLRTLIVEQLRNAGYHVIEAADCHSALQALADTSGVSLLLSDIDLPGSMDGIKFAQTIRSAHPAAKVVLTSGRHPKISATEHDGFFQKPYSPAEIINHISDLLK